MVGRKDNLPALHASIKGIARAKSKLSPDGTWKNHLPLAGNAGLHGKSIVPREGLGAQHNLFSGSDSASSILNAAGSPWLRISRVFLLT
jgi:hypothetical protein